MHWRTWNPEVNCNRKATEATEAEVNCYTRRWQVATSATLMSALSWM
ncbi:MAG: hypothetical protein ACTS6P_00835 [Candidatus Hodgkinia cicadicola]